MFVAMICLDFIDILRDYFICNKTWDNIHWHVSLSQGMSGVEGFRKSCLNGWHYSKQIKYCSFVLGRESFWALKLASTYCVLSVQYHALPAFPWNSLLFPWQHDTWLMSSKNLLDFFFFSWHLTTYNSFLFFLWRLPHSLLKGPVRISHSDPFKYCSQKLTLLSSTGTRRPLFEV